MIEGPNGDREKIVTFVYCRFCEYKNNKENSEPCFDCLDHPTNVDSHRPIHFKDNGSLERVSKRIRGE